MARLASQATTLNGKVNRMSDLRNRAKALVFAEDGPTTTEYAVMLAAIVMVCIAAIGGIGNTVSGIFTTTDASLPTGSSS